MPISIARVTNGKTGYRHLNTVIAAIETALNGVFTGTLPIAESDVTDLTAHLAAKAPLASPTLTGVPAAPTAVGGTNTTQVATTAFVAAAVAPLATVASPTFSGVPAAPTAAPGTNTTQVATTAFVTTAAAAKAPVARAPYTNIAIANTGVPDGVAHVTGQVTDAAGTILAGRFLVTVFIGAAAYGDPTDLGTATALTNSRILKADTADALLRVLTHSDGSWGVELDTAIDGTVHAHAAVTGTFTTANAAITGNA